MTAPAVTPSLLTEAQRETLASALADGIEHRRPDGFCSDCSERELLDGLCPDHVEDELRAGSYRALAADLGIPLEG